MSELVRCDLCHAAGHHGSVKERLVEWTETVRAASGVPRWDSVNRCLDFQACRSRVEAAGGTWPVRDSITRPTVTKPPERQEALA